MNICNVEHELELAPRFDRPAPRYTSYPTADRFVDTFGPDNYRAAISRRNTGGIQRPLSLYVHLPFCRDVCYYCACNKIVTRNLGKADKYLLHLEREIALQGELFKDDPKVMQMHWGGGTPTFHGMQTLGALFAYIGRWFELAPEGDYSIEIDPRTVHAPSIAELRSIGFNRVSFGVQDFDPEVQRAIHRVQSLEQTHSAIAQARCSGYRSVNLDLIYGLPKQTSQSLDRTVAQVIAESPDRIALYNYAHLPAMFAPQRRIQQADLPSSAGRVEMFGLAAEALARAGYVHVGMDHFARAEDALAVAQRHGRLRRDFQGYAAGPDCDVVGLGVSAIGAVGPTYSQNFRDLEHYYRLIERAQIPIVRGIELTSDDLVRRAVIQELMCQFSVSKEAIESRYLIDFDRYFGAELGALRSLLLEGLIEWDADRLNVTPQGRFFVRSICTLFDRHFAAVLARARFSRAV